MTNLNGKKIFMICTVLFIIFVSWYVFKSIGDVQRDAVVVANTPVATTTPQIVFDTVQLKTQKDFKIVALFISFFPLVKTFRF